jgi:putative ABC transport system permease protein
VTVVGVVADIAPDPTRPPDPVLYVPHAQVSFGYAELVLRVRGDDAGVLPALRERIWAIDPGVPLDGAYRLERAVADSVASPRFYLMIVGLFAGLAVLLAAVGVYGVTSYGVSQRATEIGVRSAMGADAGTILRLFVLDGLRPVVAGIAIGLAAAALASRAAAGFLFGVAPLEPGIYSGVAVALALVGVAAAAVPARRAAARDPLASLRHE